MKNGNDKLDALYTAWSDDRKAPSPRPLTDWLAKSPEEADELVGWTADAPLMECAEESEAPAGMEARTLEIGRQVVAEMRAKYMATPTTPLISLIDAAKAKGLSPKKLAEQLGVGLSLVAKLHQRLLQAATIPAELVESLAGTLQVSVNDVRAYLQQPATLATGASYKSDSVPQVGEQEPFAAAIRASRDMTPEQKKRWLRVTEK